MSEQGINLFSTQIGPKVMCLVPLTEGTVSSFFVFRAICEAHALLKEGYEILEKKKVYASCQKGSTLFLQISL